jgi:hypothetical protein
MIDLLKDKQIISIVGNAKNAGKTTVLNAIVNQYQSHVLLTSIGLDGEELDQVTHLEKPQVFVKKNDYIVTAKGTLSEFTATYEIVKTYNIHTAIGQIVLCRITNPGKVLIAGPSKVDEMQRVIDDVRKILPIKIIIDGAFFRQSFANVGEGVIFVVGANDSPDMSLTIEHAALSYWKLTLPKYDDVQFDLKNQKMVCVLKNNQLFSLGFASLLGHADDILKQMNEADALFIPKSITDELINCWTDRYPHVTCNLILQSGIHIQLNHQNLKRLKQLTKSIEVIHPIDVLAVCMNPTSPNGYQYHKKDFKRQLEKRLKCQVYDVKEDRIYE